MFEGKKIFAIWDDGVRRCIIHTENKLVFAQEIEIAKNSKCVLTVFNVQRWRFDNSSSERLLLLIKRIMEESYR